MSKGRKLNGEGSLRKRSDGRWEYRVMDGYRDNGKPNSISIYGHTQAEIKQKLEDYRKNKMLGLNMRKKYTFDQWSDEWFDQLDGITATTKEGYKYTLRYLQAEFGKRQLTDIKTMDLEAFLKRLRAEGKADSSVAKCRGMLFQIFNKAEANDLVRKNPVRYAEKMRSSNRMKRKEAFNEEEVKLLMAKLPQDKIGWSIRLMLGTGIRTQELLGLEPQHISEDGSLITIEQAMVRIKGGVAIGTPKSFDSYRVIPVPPGLQECAVRLRNTDKKFIWEAGKPNSPCNPSHFAKLFKEAVSSVEGVRRLTPHSCRHSFISNMQCIGVDMETIRSMAGHVEVDMTRHYLHVQDSIRTEAVIRYSNAFVEAGEEA